MGHHEKTGNDSTTKFAVIFALLFFFGVTVAGQQYFVGSESAGEETVQATGSDDGIQAAPAPDEDSSTGEKHKARKRH